MLLFFSITSRSEESGVCFPLKAISMTLGPISHLLIPKKPHTLNKIDFERPLIAQKLVMLIPCHLRVIFVTIIHIKDACFTAQCVINWRKLYAQKALKQLSSHMTIQSLMGS